MTKLRRRGQGAKPKLPKPEIVDNKTGLTETQRGVLLDMRTASLVCTLGATNKTRCQCNGTVRFATFYSLLTGGFIQHNDKPLYPQPGRDEFMLTEQGQRAIGIFDCSQCDKPVGSGAQAVGPAKQVWCKECLDNYDGPGEPDLDASSATERSEVLYRDMREAGR